MTAPHDWTRDAAGVWTRSYGHAATATVAPDPNDPRAVAVTLYQHGAVVSAGHASHGQGHTDPRLDALAGMAGADDRMEPEIAILDAMAAGAAGEGAT